MNYWCDRFVESSNQWRSAYGRSSGSRPTSNQRDSRTAITEKTFTISIAPAIKVTATIQIAEAVEV
jgi:hypothetical protein